jgi:hypothetical protein
VGHNSGRALIGYGELKFDTSGLMEGITWRGPARPSHRADAKYQLMLNTLDSTIHSPTPCEAQQLHGTADFVNCSAIMPTRRSSGNATAIESSQPTVPRLEFDEQLSWRAGKPIAVKDLLSRLTSLSTELRTLEQESFDRAAVTKVAKQLAGQHLLAHKDKGVRAWTACCLVDVLRLCAPDAPFTVMQLRVSL